MIEFSTLLTKLESAYSQKDINRAKAAANDFESQFLAVMLDQMETGLGEDDPFSGGESMKTFRSMLNEEYSKSIADAGGIGLSDAIYREILMLQETNQPR